MDVLIEELELCDAEGFFYAQIPEAMVEVDITHEFEWRIVGIEFLGSKNGKTKPVRSLNASTNADEFHRTRHDIMQTHKRYLQGCVSEHLIENAGDAAAQDADRRYDAMVQA